MLSARRWLWFELSVVAVAVVASAWLRDAGLATDSPTEDEWAHLVRGILLWQTGDARASFGHPPLANLLAAIPALWSTVPPLSTYEPWDTARAGLVALEWLKEDYEGARNVLVAGRRMMLVLHIGLVLYVYSISRTLFGATTGVVAALLAAFNPTFIAQTRYVTTDAAAGLGAILVAGEFTLYMRRSDRGTPIRLIGAVSVAILLKFSTLIVVGSAVLLGIVAAALGLFRFRGLSLAKRSREAAACLALTSLVATGAVNAAYAFSDTGLTVAEILKRPEPKGMIRRIAKRDVLEKYTVLPRLPKKLRIPLPYAYVYGLATMRGYNDQGFKPSWFAGKKTPQGSTWYFPTMIAIKSPLAWLLGLAIAMWAFLRLPTRAEAAMLFLFGAIFLAVSMRSNLNMGVRHVFPVLAIWTPLAALGLTHASDRMRSGGSVFLGGTLISVIAAAVLAAPHYLGWFNAAIGRERGHEISLVGEDWGQDRIALTKLVRERDLRPLFYHTQTKTRQLEVDWLGMEYEPFSACIKTTKPMSDPRGAWVAIHALRVERYRCYRWLRKRTPIFVVNHHIRIYWIPEDDAEIEHRLEDHAVWLEQNAAKKAREP